MSFNGANRPRPFRLSYTASPLATAAYQLPKGFTPLICSPIEECMKDEIADVKEVRFVEEMANSNGEFF